MELARARGIWRSVINSGVGLQLLAAGFISLAVYLALYGTLNSPRNWDDYWALAYVTEILSGSHNLNDPYLGSDVSVQARYQYSLWIWGFAGIARIAGVDPVWLFQEIAPPVLALASIFSIFVLLRCARFDSAVASFGCLAWVAYMVSTNTDPRLHGTFFFVRIAQDKAFIWLVAMPAILGSMLVLMKAADRVGTEEDLDGRSRAEAGRWLGWGAVASLSLLTLVATFIHPLAVVFAVALLAATIVATTVEKRLFPTTLASLGALSVIPALLAAGFYRLVVPQDVVRVFDTDLARENTYADVGPLSIADPDMFALLNVFALAWIAISLYRRRDSQAIRVSAAIYLVALLIFVPGFADILARVVSADGAWRWTWMLPLAAVLSFADFGHWMLYESRSMARVQGVLLSGLVVAVVVSAGSLSHGQVADARAKPGEERILDALDRATGESDQPSVVLATTRMSRLIPSYVPNANPMYFPGLGGVEELEVRGVKRGNHARVLDRPRSYQQIMELVEFWDADFVILERHALDEPLPRGLAQCFGTRSYRLLVVRSERASCGQATGE
jgi:hypothetical protein